MCHLIFLEGRCNYAHKVHSDVTLLARFICMFVLLTIVNTVCFQVRRVLENITTPNYAIVRFPNGHEKTVTLRDIAPVSEKQYYVNDNFQSEHLTSNETEIQGQPEENSPSTLSLEDQQNNDNLRTERENSQSEPELRRSTRDRRPPNRLTYY